MAKIEAQLREEVQVLLQKAAEVDRQEEDDGVDLPGELARREDRLKALAEAKARIAERAKVRDAEAEAAYQEKKAGREALKAEGKKPRGKEPKPPETGPRDKDQINLTDEESRIMPTANGFIQGFNAQAAVATETMLVMAAHVTQEVNDKRQLQPMLDQLEKLPDVLGIVTALLADHGYFSRDNVEACTKRDVTPFIALGREAHHLPLAERLSPSASAPETTDALALMAHHLKTADGRATYGERKSTEEPVFGIVKQVLGFRQFSLRGLKAVAGEWTLVTLAYHLKRMHAMAA
jgi:hypothetical protein